MGAGHRAVGDELGRRLRDRGRRVDSVDVLDLLPAGLGGALRVAYRGMVRRAPWLYDGVYATFMDAGRGPGSTPLARLAERGLRDAVDAYRPGVVVPVFHLAAQVTGRLRQNGALGVPATVLITDFAVHRQWLHPGNDVHLCVSADAAQQVQERLGRTAYATGPVVPERFSRLTAADSAVWSARLTAAAADRPAVLISTGSWGVADSLAETAAALAGAGYLPVILCGRDEKTRSRLAEIPGVSAYGWIEDLAGLMAASSALIDNAAGQTAVQALAAGVPVVGYRPIAGHGRQGVVRMAYLGVTEYARTPDELLRALGRLTRPGAARDTRVRAGRSLFSGDAADCVERAIAASVRR
jgi:UDP-N-acetylglucosamine:LPS N-acetylglucosamine transferase